MDKIVGSLLDKDQRVDSMAAASGLSYPFASQGNNSLQERKMQKAMSHSLADMWNDLNSLLARRHTVLYTTVNFYHSAEAVSPYATIHCIRSQFNINFFGQIEVLRSSPSH